MEKRIYIYSIKDPIDYQIKYIGKTIDIKRRFKEHISLFYLTTNTLKNNWIKKLLSEGLQPIFEIVEECPRNEWEVREKYWINYYRELGFDMKNMCDGGEGNHGLKMSVEFKNNLSKKRKGKNNPYYGKKHSDDILEKIKLASTDRNNPNATFINIVDKDGNIIFNGIRKEVIKWCKDKGVCSDSNMKNHLYSGECFNPKYVMTAYPNCKDYIGIKFVYAK
jgi:group I intron endonuclease